MFKKILNYLSFGKYEYNLYMKDTQRFFDNIVEEVNEEKIIKLFFSLDEEERIKIYEESLDELLTKSD